MAGGMGRIVAALIRCAKISRCTFGARGALAWPIQPSLLRASAPALFLFPGCGRGTTFARSASCVDRDRLRTSRTGTIGNGWLDCSLPRAATPPRENMRWRFAHRLVLLRAGTGNTSRRSGPTSSGSYSALRGRGRQPSCQGEDCRNNAADPGVQKSAWPDQVCPLEHSKNARGRSRDTCRGCVSVSSNKESQGARHLAAEISTGKMPSLLPDAPFAGRVHQLPGWPRKHERARGMMAHCPVSLHPRGGVPFEEDRMRIDNCGDVPSLAKGAAQASLAMDCHSELADAPAHAHDWRRRNLEKPATGASASGPAQSFRTQDVRTQTAESAVR